MLQIFKLRLSGLVPRHFDAAQHMNSEWRLLLPTCAFGAACAVTVNSTGPLLASWQLLLPAGVLVAFAAWFRQLAALWLQVVLAFFLGVCATVVRIDSLDVSPLRDTAYFDIAGEITKIEERADRPLRLTLQPHTFHRGTAFDGLMRVTIRGQVPDGLSVGDRVRLPARLGPSTGPITPDGFDFSRRAFFMGIAAEGFAVGPLELFGSAEPSGGLARYLEQTRLDTAETIRGHLQGESGSVATAILVGYKHFLALETAEAFRHTGLAHLMAISGLHVGLVAAAAFFALELLLAAIPSVALRVPPRKMAAVGAWFLAGGYVLLSGMGVSTIRAFLMVTIALLALLCDRRVFTIRSVLLAAMVILMLWPESIISAGFQMSFAATAALVVVYDRLQRAGLVWTHARSAPAKLLHFLVYSVLTTLVAELAIAPFALYHFQGASLVGIGANTVVVPIFSLIVMPFGLLSLILMPLGLEAVPLAITGAALDVIIHIAHWFAALEFAVGYIPLPSVAFIVAAVGLFLSFIALEGRFQFLPLLLAALVLPGMGQASSHDVLIDNEGRVIAAMEGQADQPFAIVGGRRGGFRDDNWARYWGQDPDKPPGQLTRLCDPYGCTIPLANGYLIANVTDITALRQACAEADLVIISWRWRRYCRGPATVLIREDISKLGPVGVDSATSSIRWSRTVGHMPWQVPPVGR